MDEKFSTTNLKKYISSSDTAKLNELLKTSDLTKNLFVFEIGYKKKIVLVSVKNNLETSDIENLGAEFYGRINHEKKSEYLVNSDTVSNKYKNFIGYFLHGLKLKSYEFNLYKSKVEKKIILIKEFLKKNKEIIQNQLRFKALEEGTFFARDLVSEPPNVLNPKEYANRLIKLRRLGIKVTVYNESQMKKLGMHSLLGVGRGSVNSLFY